MRARGQLVEAADHRLGDAATRAQQVPAQLQQAGAGRLQAQLDDLPRRMAPLFGELEGPDLRQIDLLGRLQMAGQALRQAVAVAGGLDGGGTLAHPLRRAGRQHRRGTIERRVAAAGGEGIGRLGQAREVSTRPLEEAAAQHGGTQQVGRRGGDGVDPGAARTVGRELEMGAQRGQRATAKFAAMLEPMVGHPIDRLFFPDQIEGALAGARHVEHRAVRSGRFLDVVERQACGLVEAGRVGQQRPDPLARVVEPPVPGTRDRFAHTRPGCQPPSRWRRPPPYQLNFNSAPRGRAPLFS